MNTEEKIFVYGSAIAYIVSLLWKNRKELWELLPAYYEKGV